MNKIGWGIIGCGDVTEKKSGPAFSRITDSRLIAVMRRDSAKAADYARRHQVPRWFDQVEDLIEDPEVTAVYIATPPGSHRELALKVAAAGKPCYVEKPMARSFSETLEMNSAFNKAKLPLYVAYYRRALPRFRKIQSLLQQKALGKILELRYHQNNTGNLQMVSGTLPWRFDSLISGGGLFIDLGSHTLDLLDYWFGPLHVLESHVEKNSQHQEIEERVSMAFNTSNGIRGHASWDFASTDTQDHLEIIGSEGKIICSVFGHEPIQWIGSGGPLQIFPFEAPEHIQQPLIAEVVQSLIHGSDCCSTGLSAQRTNAVMDKVLGLS